MVIVKQHQVPRLEGPPREYETDLLSRLPVVVLGVHVPQHGCEPFSPQSHQVHARSVSPGGRYMVGVLPRTELSASAPRVVSSAASMRSMKLGADANRNDVRRNAPRRSCGARPAETSRLVDRSERTWREPEVRQVNRAGGVKFGCGPSSNVRQTAREIPRAMRQKHTPRQGGGQAISDSLTKPRCGAKCHAEPDQVRVMPVFLTYG